MKLETFFEKFERFADAPDAVAKMRELVLAFSANGAAHASLGQRPRKTTHQTVPALKGRPNASSWGAVRDLDSGEWVAPSGLEWLCNTAPWALPRAVVVRRVAAGGTAQ
jgi:hypothetical protein